MLLVARIALRESFIGIALHYEKFKLFVLISHHFAIFEHLESIPEGLGTNWLVKALHITAYLWHEVCKCWTF